MHPIFADLLTWAGYWSGITDEAGRGYAAWSGIASLSFLAGGAVVYRKLNCHTVRCWRMGHHAVPDSAYVICKRHLRQLHELKGMPTSKRHSPTIEEIHEHIQHREAHRAEEIRSSLVGETPERRAGP